VQTLNGVRAGVPQVAAFDLPSNLLSTAPGSSQHYLLAILHCPGSDDFTGVETHVDTLCINDRKVACKMLQAVAGP
jgi:hypothetical protein